MARELQLGNALFLGKGEDASGGRSKLSILADAMEALIGAIYLDAGYSTVNGIVLQLLGERLRESAKAPGTRTTRPGSRSCAPRPTTSSPCTA